MQCAGTAHRHICKVLQMTGVTVAVGDKMASKSQSEDFMMTEQPMMCKKTIGSVHSKNPPGPERSSMCTPDCTGPLVSGDTDIKL